MKGKIGFKSRKEGYDKLLEEGRITKREYEHFMAYETVCKELLCKAPEIEGAFFHVHDIAILGDTGDEKAYSVSFFRETEGKMIEHILTADITENGKIKKVYRYGGDD